MAKVVLGLTELDLLNDALAIEDDKIALKNKPKEESFEFFLQSLTIENYKLRQGNELKHFVGQIEIKDVAANLKRLGFAGSIPTQWMFVKVFHGLIEKELVQKAPTSSSGDLPQMASADSENHCFIDYIFESEPDLLSRLIWCASFEDQEIQSMAVNALKLLSANLMGKIIQVTTHSILRS